MPLEDRSTKQCISCLNTISLVLVQFIQSPAGSHLHLFPPSLPSTPQPIVRIDCGLLTPLSRYNCEHGGNCCRGSNELLARNFMIPEFSSVQDAITFLDTSAHYLTVSKYVTYAFFALLIYDHLLTLPEEARIVWLGRPSFVKALFLFNRYFSPIFVAIDIATLSGGVHLTDKFCRTWLNTDEVFELLSLVSTTLIITFRVHAVLGSIRGFLPVLLSIWGGQAVISAILVLVQVIIKGSHTITAEPTFKVCVADVQGGKFWVTWIPSMAFHTFIFSLLVWKAVSTPRDSQTPMLMLLIRDGVLYFGVVFVAFLFNLIVWAVAPVTLAIMPHDSVWCITTIALSRLMLSMDVIASSGTNPDDDDIDAANEPASTSTRPMSVATIPLSLRRNFEKKMASFRRASVGTPPVRSQTPASLAETVFLETWRPSTKDHSRRSSRNSDEEADYSMPVRRHSQGLLSDSPSMAQAAWYPGAISESFSGTRHDRLPPSGPSISPRPGSRSPSPIMYVRPLPPIPTLAVARTSSEKRISNFASGPQTRERPMSTTSQDFSKTHYISTSLSSMTDFSGPNTASPRRNTFGPLLSIPPSNAQSASRASGAMAPPLEISEIRALPPRPPIASYGPSDLSLLTDSTWQDMTTYSQAPQRDIVDRRGEIKRSDYGGVEL